MKKTFFLLLLLFAQRSGAQNFYEGFDNVISLYTSGGWFSINNSSPSNTNIWFTDADNFTAHSGASNSCISAGWYCTDTVGTGDASVWLFTPPLMLHNGDTLSFYTISYNNADYADRLEVRLNTTNTDTTVGTTSTSVGNYTGLLLTVNPTLNNTDYPQVWTKYEMVLATIPGGAKMGRIAFRYNVPNTGGMGINGSVVGIDDVELKSIVSGIETHVVSPFIVYPNPVSGVAHISGNDVLQSVTLRDAQGRICVKADHVFSGQYDLDVQALPAGVYLLETVSGQGVFSQRIVVE